MTRQSRSGWVTGRSALLSDEGSRALRHGRLTYIHYRSKVYTDEDDQNLQVGEFGGSSPAQVSWSVARYGNARLRGTRPLHSRAGGRASKDRSHRNCRGASRSEAAVARRA